MNSYRISLKAARVNADLTIIEAAEMIGVSKDTLKRWERDASDISPEYALKIMQAYCIPIDLIHFGNDNERLTAIKEQFENII